jgi:hypothetical protein
MYFRKKIRKRILIVALVVFSFVFYRGLKAATEKTHDCEFKLIYAACVEKSKGAKLPGLWSIIKSGVSF